MRNLLALLIALALAACGDTIGSGGFPQINVNVDNTDFAQDGNVFIGEALQTTVTRNIRVVNTGTADLRVTGVEWAKDAEGKELKNPHVEVSFNGQINEAVFPFTIEPRSPNPLTFSVRYTPPMDRPLSDFSDSVLLIKSNARTRDGRDSNGEIRITFSMLSNTPAPRVSPISYNFQNATSSIPETQVFTIYNDRLSGSGAFRILSVALETPSNEFTLMGVPSANQEVLPSNAPGYADVTFTVQYKPMDGGSGSNAILIRTDSPSNSLMRVPLTSSINRGSYSLSFEHPNKFDFTNVSSVETRSVVITSEGPGAITIRQPAIEPAEARNNFTLRAFVPASSAGGTDEEITSWPRGLNVGRSIRLEVTYQPSTTGEDTANGQIQITYTNPEAGIIALDLLGGEPKSKLVIAPVIENIGVSGDRNEGESGTRKLVLYNEGNAPLELKAMRVEGAFVMPPKVWDLVGTFNPLTIQPNDMHIVELFYDLGEMGQTSTVVTESLFLTYHNDFTNSDIELTLSLYAENTLEARPTANPGDSASYANAVVGQSINLSGAASTGTILPNGYLWYLTSKPAGSQAKLNIQARDTAFIPDVAGEYKIELVTFGVKNSTTLYSLPTEITIQVNAQ